MRARKVANSRSHGATIEEIDHLVETNEVILERFDVDDEINHSSISPKRPSISTSQDVSSSRTKKRAKKVVEDDTSMREISKTLKTMVEVFKMSSEELVKQSKSANGGDIWAELVEIGVEPASLPKVYMHLVKNVDALKAFNGIPVITANKCYISLCPTVLFINSNIFIYHFYAILCVLSTEIEYLYMNICRYCGVLEE